MTPNEYKKLALVTESDNFRSNSLLGKISFFIFNYFHKDTLALRLSSKRSIRLLHSFVGIATEIEELLTMLDSGLELDRVNLKEEIADCLWYCAVAADELDMDLDAVLGNLSLVNWNLSEDETRRQIETHVRALVKANGRTLDLIKKGTFYGKPLDVESVKTGLITLFAHLYECCHLGGFSMEDAMERNIAKLSARYKGKFSTNLAFNRDLKVERNILEGKN